VQAIARGELATLAEARELVRVSFTPVPYEPRDPGPWDEAYERFADLAGAGARKGLLA